MPVTLRAFQEWAKGARHGQAFIYHEEGQPRIGAVWNYARSLSDSGLAFITSKRIGDRWCKIVIRCSPNSLEIVNRVSASIPSPPAVCSLYGTFRRNAIMAG